VQSVSVRFTILIGVLASIPAGAVRADIFRCLAPDGRTLYSDAPCPRGATRSSNITTEVGACSTSECAAQHEQAAGNARERLRSEQEVLANLTDRRLRAELDAATEQARAQDLARRQLLEARLAATSDDTVYAAGYPLYYPNYLVRSGVRPCGGRCTGPHPRPHATVPAKHTRSTALRLDRR
jgi:hypothetical protein